MYKFKNSLIAMSGLATIAVVVPMLLPFVGLGVNTSGGSAPTSQTQNVLVVNSGTQAVPVSGSMQAQQSGTWNVGINGTPTVGLASGTSVSVDGAVKIDPQNNTVNIGTDNTVKIDGTSPVPIRDVENPARNVFVYSNGSSMPNGAANADYSFTVPANKRLVIEQVSAWAEVNPATDQIVSVVVDGQSGGTPTAYFMIAQDNGTAGIYELYTASSQMRTYAEPGNPVTVGVHRNDANGGGTVNVYLSGYLVDVP